jgi:hypothetical protein
MNVADKFCDALNFHRWAGWGVILMINNGFKIFLVFLNEQIISV